METAAGATQRRIHYALANDSGGLVGTLGSGETEGPDTRYIDVFKDLSLLNHRLMRQGRVPMVRFGFAGPFEATTTYAQVSVQYLPNTWPVRKAHQLALKEYLLATKDERRRGGQARWHDFKVYLEDDQRTGSTMSPVGITQGSAEWNYSEIYQQALSANVQYKFIGSSDGNAYGMIAEYDQQQDTDDDSPDNPGGNLPYGGLHPHVDSTNQDNLLDEGDSPPYNPDALQVQLPIRSIAVGTGKSDKMVSDWFPAPCGLLKVMSVVTSSGSVAADTIGTFWVEVAAGDYKGVHATPMGMKL
jgi:hypothetical protein